VGIPMSDCDRVEASVAGREGPLDMIGDAAPRVGLGGVVLAYQKTEAHVAWTGWTKGHEILYQTSRVSGQIVGSACRSLRALLGNARHGGIAIAAWVDRSDSCILPGPTAT